MNDSYETKAALLAVKESCSLPVFVSNVFDEQGRLMTGADPEAMTAMLEGLGADAIGINCSLGPNQMLQLLPRFISHASVPIIMKPNAGLPHTENGKTVFSVGPQEFAAVIRKAALGGARLIGGCCGTTPEYIRAIVDATRGLAPIPFMPKKETVISSYSQALYFGDKPVIIGERLNPSGKRRMKDALRASDMAYIVSRE
jgi:5-methyltetrahydrofolate--homocysteine methyltransferase